MGFFDRIFNRGNGMPAVNFFGYLDGGCYNEIDLSCISGHNAAYEIGRASCRERVFRAV